MNDSGILREGGQKSLNFENIKGQMRKADYIDITETELRESRVIMKSLKCNIR